MNAAAELERAVARLRDQRLEVMLQEIIPGREEFYEFYTYLNKKSVPLAVCGWDKIRHYPPEFGSGSFCRTNHRPEVIEPAIRLLKALGYHGLAAPELKRDPRDGQYKMLEINARPTLQSQLATACGVDITYIAYLDAIGEKVGDLPPPPDNVFWVDDFVDQLSCLILLSRKEIGLGELARQLTTRKVHSVAAWDDPLPLIVYGYHLGAGALRRLAGNITGPH